MPRKKTRKSGSGRPAEDYSKLDDRERKKYHKEAMSVLRGKDEPNSSSEEEQEPKMGRPPLLDKAMTPRTLRKRKRDLVTEKRSAEKVSKARQKSVNLRWETSNNNEGNGENDIQPLEIETPNVTPEKQSASTSDEPNVTISERTMFRLKGTSHDSIFQFSLFSTLADIFAV